MVSDKTVAGLLDELGYSLQANCKKIALSGKGSREERIDRDLQFRRICRMRERFARNQNPVISVDTKKKELIGNFKNPGRVRRDGSVYLGLSHDTAAFAVDSICSWWKQYGSVRPHARHILILADNGGSNSPSNAAWRYHLWDALCRRCGLKVTVCHYPTGASKWNPIEHRLFSEISKNWAGVPLTDIETAIKYIRKTKTKTGLKVTAALNRNHYQLKKQIADELQARVLITRNQLFPKLNYTLSPAN
jgi:hypothetical protein